MDSFAHFRICTIFQSQRKHRNIAVCFVLLPSNSVLISSTLNVNVMNESIKESHLYTASSHNSGLHLSNDGRIHKQIGRTRMKQHILASCESSYFSSFPNTSQVPSINTFFIPFSELMGRFYLLEDTRKHMIQAQERMHSYFMCTWYSSQYVTLDRPYRSCMV